MGHVPNVRAPPEERSARGSFRQFASESDLGTRPRRPGERSDLVVSRTYNGTHRSRTPRSTSDRNRFDECEVPSLNSLLTARRVRVGRPGRAISYTRFGVPTTEGPRTSSYKRTGSTLSVCILIVNCFPESTRTRGVGGRGVDPDLDLVMDLCLDIKARLKSLASRSNFSSRFIFSPYLLFCSHCSSRHFSSRHFRHPVITCERSHFVTSNTGSFLTTSVGIVLHDITAVSHSTDVGISFCLRLHDVMVHIFLSIFVLHVFFIVFLMTFCFFTLLQNFEFILQGLVLAFLLDLIGILLIFFTL